MWRKYTRICVSWLTFSCAHGLHVCIYCPTYSFICLDCFNVIRWLHLVINSFQNFDNDHNLMVICIISMKMAISWINQSKHRNRLVVPMMFNRIVVLSVIQQMDSSWYSDIMTLYKLSEICDIRYHLTHNTMIKIIFIFCLPGLWISTQLSP